MYIHNISTIERTYIGQSVASGSSFLIPEELKVYYANNEALITDIMNAHAAISIDGTNYLNDKMSMLNHLKNDGSPVDSSGLPIHSSQNTAFSNNLLADGKVLYTKIHGMKTEVPAGQEYTFFFQVPIEYSNGVYFNGAEILQDIIGVSDFDLAVPDGQGGHVPVEKYGYDVNMGTIKYIRESKYAALVPPGIFLRCVYKNDTPHTQEVGVNFLMHEIRNP